MLAKTLGEALTVAVRRTAGVALSPRREIEPIESTGDAVSRVWNVVEYVPTPTGWERRVVAVGVPTDRANAMIRSGR